MRTYTVFYKNDEGANCQYKVQATDRFQAKYKTVCDLNIALSQIYDVL